eukprot:TRINITY_DN30455_c0_g1_i1.p1 TRINITY_DN30455_c0_g1~~TRINITY_DN30455_c0_g1_i1.p1  ORF type:complete len:542 (+),score=173.38 TRINITY_DN30455_c0_g1_i1:59-1684(+)
MVVRKAGADPSQRKFKGLLKKKKKKAAGKATPIAKADMAVGADAAGEEHDCEASASEAEADDDSVTASLPAVSADCLSETARRNVALEAVRAGNYWAPPEEQPAVLAYIKECHQGYLGDGKWLAKNLPKLSLDNGLTKRYTVAEILGKKHEADGYDVYFAKADESVAAHDTSAEGPQADAVSEGTMLVAKRETRVFKAVDGWKRIRNLMLGERVEAAGPPKIVDGCGFKHCMVAIKPEGAVELQYMDIVNAEEEAAAAAASAAQEEVDTGRLAELQEGMDALAAAADGSGDPVETDELLELLEGCVQLGELGAAVYCGERLEGLCEGSVASGDILDRVFAALKTLLKPNSGRAKPALTGPWTKPPPGRVGVPNPRKGLGQLVNRIAIARKQVAADAECATAAAGGEASGSDKQQETLDRFCRALSPLLSADEEAAGCKRRNAFAQVVARLCTTAGLSVSQGLAYLVVGQLEKLGALTSKGRDMALAASKPAKKGAQKALAACSKDLELLEKMTQERMERKKKRLKARQAAKATKRRRTEEE